MSNPVIDKFLLPTERRTRRIGIDERADGGRQIDRRMSVVRNENQSLMFGRWQRAKIRTILGHDNETVLAGVWKDLAVVCDTGFENIDDEIGVIPTLGEW